MGGFNCHCRHVSRVHGLCAHGDGGGNSAHNTNSIKTSDLRPCRFLRAKLKLLIVIYKYLYRVTFVSSSAAKSRIFSLECLVLCVNQTDFCLCSLLILSRESLSFGYETAEQFSATVMMFA